MKRTLMQLFPAFRFYICIMLVAALSACTHYVRDVEFVGVEPATPSMIKDVSYTDFPVNNPDGKAVIRKPDPLALDTLRIRFRSREDLTKLDGEDYMRVSLCPYQDEPIVGLSNVFSGGYELGNLRTPTGTIISKEWNSGVYVGSVRYDGPSGIQPKDGYFYYESFFTYKSQSLFVGELHTSIELPLPKTLQDLCFKIVGVSIPWPGYETNIAVIPAEALKKALAQQKIAKTTN